MPLQSHIQAARYYPNQNRASSKFSHPTFTKILVVFVSRQSEPRIAACALLRATFLFGSRERVAVYHFFVYRFIACNRKKSWLEGKDPIVLN